jgi:hypothetical protein
MQRHDSRGIVAKVEIISEDLAMHSKPEEILSILDCCCDAFTFPMLDNGYVYLAATRLSLYRSATDWAMVIEVFGFSPRAGLPDTHIQTFASRLKDRNSPEQYVSREAYENYLANNPYNDTRFVFPIEEGNWQDPEGDELVAENASTVDVRGLALPLPPLDRYEQNGVELQQPPRVHVYELCRYLAEIERGRVLATRQERRISVLPDMNQFLQLEEWHHPNVVDDDDRPSGSKTFQQLARVLTTGDVKLYRPSRSPNTHWRNWPEGGRL